MNRNYQKELDNIIEKKERMGEAPKLLLHSCCGPCSSYCLEYLSRHFSITDFFYNPNITDENEYRKRAAELERLIKTQPHRHAVSFVLGKYEPERFRAVSSGYEQCAEGGQRCVRCFALRLDEAARVAAAWKMDFVTTTLTISPLKRADVINAIGERAAAAHGVRWLPSDFKKRGGYQRSIELSREYGLYRQDFCGCGYSKRRDLDLHQEVDLGDCGV